MATVSPDIKIASARAEWLHTARPAQLTPDGDWRIWLLMAGRGFGKTRTGSEDLGWYGWRHDNNYLAVVAPTTDAARDVCFEGPAGLLKTIPPECIKHYHRSMVEMELTNGTKILSYSSETPERLRGPQFHRAWCDELGAWKAQNMKKTWDMLNFGLRLGDRPQAVVTTTPKPFLLFRELVRAKSTYLTTGSTYENKDNLAKSFFADIVKYEGTTIGRQEIHGELIDLEEMGIFKRSWFQLYPAGLRFPSFSMIISSWDTALTEKSVDKESRDPDPTANSVWGVFSLKDALPPELLEKRGLKYPNGVMLIDNMVDHLGFPDLMKKVREATKVKYGHPGRRMDVLLVEDEGSGKSLRQVLNREGIPVRRYNPGNASKLQRAHIVSHIVANKMLWIPESSKANRKGMETSWATGFLDEICGYAGEGTTQHDDQLDTMTQALRFMDLTGSLPLQAPTVRDTVDAELRSRGGGNPYDQMSGVEGNQYV